MSMKRLSLFLGGGLAALQSLVAAASFYVNYDVVVPTGPLRLHPVSIVHQDAQVDLVAAHAAGNKVLAYLSVGEIAFDASYRAKAMERGLSLRGRNPVWDSDIIDLSDGRWADLLVDEVATEALAKGYDGFLLDTLDSIAPADRPAAVALVKRLRGLKPTGMIIANRGFDLLSDFDSMVDGVLAESVFGTFDFEQKVYRAVAPSETTQLINRLRSLAQGGLKVYVLDYADPRDEKGAYRMAEQIQTEGWSAFVSTPALQGESLAPWRIVPRRVFSFFGNQALDPVDRINWPAESFTAMRLQTPLEWLGYFTSIVSRKP